MSVGEGTFEAGAAINCSHVQSVNLTTLRVAFTHTLSLLNSETSLPHTYHKGEGTVGSSKQFESTCHGRQ